MLLNQKNGGSTATVIPSKYNMTPEERTFMANYSKIVTKYKSKVYECDFGASMIPPQHVYVEIRVVDDSGERITEVGVVRLEKGTQHYLKRVYVEDLVKSGAVYIL